LTPEEKSGYKPIAVRSSLSGFLHRPQSWYDPMDESGLRSRFFLRKFLGITAEWKPLAFPVKEFLAVVRLCMGSPLPAEGLQHRRLGFAEKLLHFFHVLERKANGPPIKYEGWEVSFPVDFQNGSLAKSPSLGQVRRTEQDGGGTGLGSGNGLGMNLFHGNVGFSHGLSKLVKLANENLF
jgi:hypothetical protein